MAQRADGAAREEAGWGGNTIVMLVQVAAIAFLVNQFMGGSAPAGKSAPATSMAESGRQVHGFEDDMAMTSDFAGTSSQTAPKQAENPLAGMFGMVTAPVVHPALEGFEGARNAALNRVRTARCGLTSPRCHSSSFTRILSRAKLTSFEFQGLLN